jgi:hypothetical protein
MKKFSKKGVLLFVGAMAVCAFVMPSMASAASWGPIGLHTVLDSPDIGFTSTSPTFGPVVSSCTRSSFTANVVSATNLNISTASFGGHCTWVFPLVSATCTATLVSTGLPWRATAVTTSNIQIHGVSIDLLFENTPGNPQCGAVTGQAGSIAGTLTSGRWTGNAAGQREVIFSNAEGLSVTTAGSTTPLTTRGTIGSTGALTVS